MKEIISALIKAQANIGAATKDATNPHFKNKYATLESVIEAVKGPLLDQKITIVHRQGPDDTLVTTLYHESGESIETSSKLLLDRQNMQSLGSAQTYAKRYNLTSLLNLPIDGDDDGNAASLPEIINTKAAVQGMKTEQAVASNSDFGTGKYIMLCGNNNVKGKKLIDIDVEQLKSSINFFRSKGQALTGNVKESIESAEAYFSRINKQIPKLDETEKSPF